MAVPLADSMSVSVNSAGSPLARWVSMIIPARLEQRLSVQSVLRYGGGT